MVDENDNKSLFEMSPRALKVIFRADLDPSLLWRAWKITQFSIMLANRTAENAANENLVDLFKRNVGSCFLLSFQV